MNCGHFLVIKLSFRATWRMRAVECASAHSASTHYLKNGDFCRFADWRFIHHARLNLVPLNGVSTRRTNDRRCRQCSNNIESLAHVTNHWFCYSSLYLARHNSLENRIKKAVAGKFDIISENQVINTQILRLYLVVGIITLIINCHGYIRQSSSSWVRLFGK